jgi:hypothetical protein
VAKLLEVWASSGWASVRVWLDSRNQSMLQLGTGNADSTFGIVLTASASYLPDKIGTNAGFQWLQLLTGTSMRPRLLQSTDCVSKIPLPALDGRYPMFVSNYFDDAPGRPLPSNYGELSGGNAFTAYLMWDPALPSGCTRGTGSTSSATCTSIPIPVGNLKWSWSGDAINTLAAQPNGTTYNQNCGFESGDAVAFSPGGPFPNWGSIAPLDELPTDAFICSPPLP